jgi:hypothetical protein
MRRKKGVTTAFSFIIKVALIVILFLILATTLHGMFNKAKKAVLDLVDKQYEQFNFADGVLYHPDLDRKYIEFWQQGVKPTITTAVTGKTPCLGSFYANEGLNLKGAQLRFVMNPGKGIDVFMLDDKGVVAILDQKVLAGERWNLCVIDDPSSLSSLMQQTKKGLTSDSFDFSSIQFKSVEDLYIDITDLKGDEGIKVGYYTHELLVKKNQQAQANDKTPLNVPEFFYPTYTAGQTLIAKGDERLHFFFFVKDNNFCIVRTEKGQGFYAYDFKSFLMDKAKSEKLDFLNKADNPLCQVPGDPDPAHVNETLFGGERSAYYIGCITISRIFLGTDVCSDVSSKHPKLCFVAAVGNDINDDICSPCQYVTKCSDYKNFVKTTSGRASLCKNNPCGLEGGCVPGQGKFLFFKSDKCNPSE